MGMPARLLTRGRAYGGEHVPRAVDQAPLTQREWHCAFDGADQASRAVYESVLETCAGGVRTVDLGGQATTSEFTDAVACFFVSHLKTGA